MHSSADCRRKDIFNPWLSLVKNTLKRGVAWISGEEGVPIPPAYASAYSPLLFQHVLELQEEAATAQEEFETMERKRRHEETLELTETFLVKTAKFSPGSEHEH